MSFTGSTSRYQRVRSRLLPFVLVFTLLTQVFQPVWMPVAKAQLDPLTIGGLIGLIELVTDKLNSVIETASDEARVVIQDLNDKLTSLKDELRTDIQSTVNISTTSIDNLSRTKLYEVQQLLYEVNRVVSENVGQIEEATLNVLRQASITVAQSLSEVSQTFDHSVVVATEAGVFLIDRTTNNIITIGSLFLLLLGLLIVIILLFVKRLRSGFQRILLLVVLILFVGIGSLFTFLPQVRMEALGSAGIASRLETLTNQPQLFAYNPYPIILGQTPELILLGRSLRPNGSDPVASIGGSTVPLNAASDDSVVINLNGFPAPANPSVSVQLQYPDVTYQPAFVVSMFTPTPIPQPPNLTLTGFSVSASVAEMNQSLTASVSVQNTGGTRSGPSLIRVSTGGPTTPDARPVPELNPGESASVQVPFSYPQPGAYSVSATVDPASGELNGGDNATGSSILVTVLNPVVQFNYEGPVLTRVNWPGSRGQDTFNDGVVIGADCRITHVYLDVFEGDRASSRTLATIEPGQSASLGSGATWGAYFVESNVGTNNFRVVVNWWQDIHLALHYRIRYVVEGRACQSPPFTVIAERR